MKHDKDTLIRNMDQIEQQGRISIELATIGSQCRGERHIQIIESQKIALSEMRQKMKILEVTKVPSEICQFSLKVFSWVFEWISAIVDL